MYRIYCRTVDGRVRSDREFSLHDEALDYLTSVAEEAIRCGHRIVRFFDEDMLVIGQSWDDAVVLCVGESGEEVEEIE